MKTSRELRRAFLSALLLGLRVTWPILSLLLGSIIFLGIAVGLIEGWSTTDAIYFACVTGLTIGYGDLVPTTFVARTLSILIGVCGILFTALIAAVAVKALATTFESPSKLS